MKKILILLFVLISFGVSAQKYVTDGQGNYIYMNGSAVKSPGVPVYTDTSDTGEGQVLWFNDLESLSLTDNMVEAHVDTIFGYTTQSHGFSRGAGYCEIKDDGDGNQYMRFRMTEGVGGGSNNVNIEKPLREELGGAANTNHRIEMWCGANMRFDPTMEDSITDSGKMPTGFRGGANESLWVDPYVDGFSARKTYSVSGSHRMQLYYAQQTTTSGQSSDGWSYQYPDDYHDAYIGDNGWHSFWMRHVMDPNPPDSTDSFFEFYVDGQLGGYWPNTKTRSADSIWIDWFTCGWFPGNDEEPTDTWYVDVDDIGVIIFTDGDSTLTGTERSPDYNTVTFPGYPNRTDTTNWGKY